MMATVSSVQQTKLCHVMTNFGERLTDEEVGEMLCQADVDAVRSK